MSNLFYGEVKIIYILLEIDNERNLEQLTNTLLHDGWILMSSQKNPCMHMAFNKGYTKEGFKEIFYHKVWKTTNN
ncbi:hypothetical protein [Clostridium sp. FP1]|uniref:hypothetical protein n=1 Tax=Clostridium sp. FP1 TaxID=2724076 RepID=UPI001CCC145D|nr:hypothetical protein [Clostridium sp. FP1]MBZ9634297.1 hypothetical protein [Clostridium sp. FP1]